MAAMTRSRLPQTLRVREKTARAGLARRKADRRRHAAIEELERRLVMSAVSWTGLGDGTTWQDLNNWSTKAVPGGSDDVTINVANNPPIIYNGTSSIHSLVDNDSLNIAGGSLTVTSGLTVGSGATLSATNAGTSFTASGATTIDGANLYASGGATLSLPAATSYTQNTGSWNSNRTLQASGAGSVLALPNLTTITGSTQYGSNLYVQALAGGHVNLGAATAVTGGAVNLTADGTNSVLDLSALQSFQGYFEYQYYTSTSNIQATNGGTIVLNSGTVNLTGADVSAASTGTIVGGTLQLSGGTLSGNSTIQASVFNSAATGPGSNGVGTLTIVGNFTQTSTGSLNIEIGGTTDYDRLAVTETATLDGTLSVSLINNFSPGVGNSFQIMTFGSRSGDFASKLGLTLPNDQALDPVYNAGSLTLQTKNTTATTIALVSSANPTVYGQALTFTATVSPAVTGVPVPTPTGTLQFQIDGTNWGSAITLVNGAATSDPIATLTAGDHQITAIYSGDTNYSANTTFITQTVSKAHLTVTADNQSRTYGQDNPNLTYTLSGFVNGDTSSVVSGTPVPSTAASAASPVGTYAITVDVTGLSAANYDFTGQAATLSVSPAHLTVTADNQTKIQGNPNPTLTYTLSGFVNGDTSSVVSGAATLSTTATTSSPPGSYPITVGVGSLAAANYDFPAANLIPGTLTIVAQTGVLVAVNPNTNPSTYGQAVTFSVTVSPTTAGPTPTGSVQFQADGTNFGSAVTLVNGAATSPAISALTAGEHTITAIYSGDSNYASAPGSASQTVNKAHLTVTAGNQSMTYGGTVPTPTYTITGFVNGDTQSVVSGTPTLNPGATSSSPVGTYAITVSAGSLTAANYDFPAANLISGTLTVNKAHLTVTADNQTKIQGNPNPTLTYTISGFVNGDTSSVISGAATLSTTATTSSPIGSYPITVGVGSLAAANYDFPAANLIPGTLTIVAQTGVLLAVNPNTNPSTYGQAVTCSVTVSPTTAGPTPAGSVQFQADATNFGSAVTLVNGAATSPAIASLSVGGHTITALYLGDSTYASASGSTSQTVNAAHITVTADNQTKIQGNPNPTLTYTISGFVNGDTSSVVSGAATLSTTATTSSPIGS